MGAELKFFEQPIFHLLRTIIPFEPVDESGGSDAVSTLSDDNRHSSLFGHADGIFHGFERAGGRN